MSLKKLPKTLTKEEALKLLSQPNKNTYKCRYLFSTPKYGKLSDREIREVVSRYAHKAGIEKHVNPNMLRHTFAIELLQEGYSIREVQRLLGHTDVHTTMIYTHVYDSALANKMRLRKPIDI